MRRCLILYGLTCLIGQVLSVRELATAFHGNELVYGVVLAVWLLLFAAGSAGLGRLAGKYSLGVPAFALALAGGGALVPAAVLLARTSRYFLFGGGGIAPSLGGVLLATFVSLAPLCLVLGFFYALACSIASRLDESAASAAARVYLGEAIGTFLGGILLTYILLQAMDALEIALILAATDCLAGFAVWRHSSRAAEKRGWALLACCALFSATALSALSRSPTPYLSFGGVIDLLSLTPRFEGRVLLYSADTIYGRVDVAENHGQEEFYQNGSLVGTTHMDRSAEEAAFLAVLAHPAPGRMLIIGGAVNGVLSKALELPWMKVDDVELDPELVAAARQYGDEAQKAALNPTDRARILTGADGRLVVKRCVERYDVILSAAPNPTTGLINRFYTREFFDEARHALKRDGLLALGLEGTPRSYMSAPQRALAAEILATLQSVFGKSVAAFPSDNRVYFLASKSSSFPDAAAWPLRMRTWGMRPAWLAEGVLAEITNPARALQFQASLKGGAINTDMRPAAYYQELLLWAEAFQIGGTQLLRWALRLDIWSVLFFIAMATGILALAAAFTSRPIRVGLPATRAYAGLAGIVLEMALVFAFQSLYGYVYGQLGILFAAFMLGTAAGAVLAAGFLTSPANFGTLAVCQMALALLAALFVPVLFWLERSGAGIAPIGATVVVPFLNFCVGAIVGVQYPVSVALGAAESDDLPRPGAMAAGLYAMELAGAGVGALLAGAVLIPVLGIFMTCWAICALSLASLPLLALAARRRQRTRGASIGSVG
jgi:spermidine synthase